MAKRKITTTQRINQRYSYNAKLYQGKKLRGTHRFPIISNREVMFRMSRSPLDQSDKEIDAEIAKSWHISPKRVKLCREQINKYGRL